MHHAYPVAFSLHDNYFRVVVCRKIVQSCMASQSAGISLLVFTLGTYHLIRVSSGMPKVKVRFLDFTNISAEFFFFEEHYVPCYPTFIPNEDSRSCRNRFTLAGKSKIRWHIYFNAAKMKKLVFFSLVGLRKKRISERLQWDQMTAGLWEGLLSFMCHNEEGFGSLASGGRGETGWGLAGVRN